MHCSLSEARSEGEGTMMTKAMQDLGRLAAVAGISVGIGAVIGALGIAGYRRRQDDRGTPKLARDGNSMDDIAPHGDLDLDALRVESAKMDEQAEVFAGVMPNEVMPNEVIENDEANDVAEGNARAMNGLHTEEKPRSKGSRGKRSPNGARTRKNVNGHM